MTTIVRSGVVRSVAVMMAGLLAVTVSAVSPAPTGAVSHGEPAILESEASEAPHATEDPSDPSEAVMLEGPTALTGDMVAVGGLLYFIARGEGSGRRLWRSDGTSEGTRPVDTCWTVLVCGPTLWPWELFGRQALVAAGDLVYFSTSQGFWRSDGTAAGTFMVAKDADMSERDRGPRGPDGAERRRLMDEVCDVLADGARLYVVASVDCSDPAPRQLWVTDGTRRGTRMLERSLDAFAQFISRSVRSGRKRLFGAEGGLWTTDGTPKGTRSLTDPRAADRSDGPWDVTSADGRAWFTREHGARGSELWVSDGTSGGTRMTRAIRPPRYEVGIELASHATLDGGILFVANDTSHGREPWVSDGTRAGTRLLRDIRPGRAGSLQEYRWEHTTLGRVGSQVFLVADDGVHGSQLWATDGTAAGTRMLTDVPAEQGAIVSVTGWEHGDTALLATVGRSDAPPTSDDLWVDRIHLWRSDGTPEGTSLLRELGSIPLGGPCDSEGRAVGQPGSESLYFLAPEGDAGCRLWRTDGTTTGTFTLDDGRAWDPPIIVADRAYFITYSGDEDAPTSVLWRTDGTRAGTTAVSRAGPTRMLAVDDGLYFLAGDGGHAGSSCRSSSCRLWFLPTGRDEPGALPSTIPSTSPAVEPPRLSPRPSAAGELAAAFPREVGGRPVSVLERRGTTWLASYDPADPDDAAAIAAIEGFVDSLGRSTDDLTVASALVPVKGGPAAITAVRVAGAERGALVDAVLPFLFADTVTPTRARVTVGGKEVIRVKDAAIPGAYPRYIRPRGDTLWLVEADARYLDEILRALP